MAREIRTFSVVVATGSTKTSPQYTQLAMPPRVVRQITVDIPPGPRGEVGFQIGNAKTNTIPIVAGTWIVTDDRVIPWQLEGYVTSGTWWLIAYNTGDFTHTLQVTFLLDLTTTGAQAVPGSAGALATLSGPNAASPPGATPSTGSAPVVTSTAPTPLAVTPKITAPVEPLTIPTLTPVQTPGTPTPTAIAVPSVPPPPTLT